MVGFIARAMVGPSGQTTPNIRVTSTHEFSLRRASFPFALVSVLS